MTMRLKPKVKRFLKLNLETFATLAGVGLGVILGIIFSYTIKSGCEETCCRREAMYVKFIGSLFFQMLEAIVIPVVIPSLIVAVGSLDLKLSGKYCAIGLGYYLSTTICAVTLGIILVISIKPGKDYEDEPPANTACAILEAKEKENITGVDNVLDLIRNLFPSSIPKALTTQMKTELIYSGPDLNGTVPDKYDWPFEIVAVDESNMLGLVVFSLAFGFGIACIGEEAKPILDFFTSVSNVMMKLTTWIIKLAPIGVMFLIAGDILQEKEVAKSFASLGLYFATVVVGLTIHGTIVLPIIYGLFTWTWPFRFVANMGNALATAFGTASSSATLPIMIDALERKNKVDPRITRLIIPVGVTINMDGAALYEAVAAVYIAYRRNVEVTVGRVIVISLASTFASIGDAGIPQSGLVTMVMVLNAVELSSEDIALIMAVDWLLDRFCTATNVLGDAIGAGIVYHLSKKELAKMDGVDVEEEEEETTSQTDCEQVNNNGWMGNGRVNHGFSDSTDL